MKELKTSHKDNQVYDLKPGAKNSYNVIIQSFSFSAACLNHVIHLLVIQNIFK